MRVSASILSALVASAHALNLFNGDSQKALSPNEIRKVPGESPLEYCPNKQDDGFIEIKQVDLNPNPPAAGKTLSILAKGTVKKTIVEGAYANITVKFGRIPILTRTIDLCEQLEDEDDLKCPVKPGEIFFTKDVELPKEIPPVTYDVVADVFSADDERITCLTATVLFRNSGSNVADNEL